MNSRRFTVRSTNDEALDEGAAAPDCPTWLVAKLIRRQYGPNARLDWAQYEESW